MASHTISILGAATFPDLSGEVFFEPYSIKDTATILDPMVLIFNNSGTKDGVRGSFTIPQDYSSAGTTQFQVIWTANDGTTNSVQFDLSYLNRSGSEDMGAAAQSTSDTVAGAKNATAFARNQANIDVTEANFVAGDICLFELFRDSVTDLLAADVIVFEVLFKYDDS